MIISGGGREGGRGSRLRTHIQKKKFNTTILSLVPRPSYRPVFDRLQYESKTGWWDSKLTRFV